MAAVKSLRKIVGKKAKIDWRKVAAGVRLRKRLLDEGLQTRDFRTLSPGYGRRARILDDVEHDARIVTVRRSY